ncbi:MAG: NHL repeat-containing protein [bacterium]
MSKLKKISLTALIIILWAYPPLLAREKRSSSVIENYPLRIIRRIYGVDSTGRPDTEERGGSPTYIAQNSKGNLYVAYTGNRCEIQVFDTAGKFLFRFGRRGDKPGEFSEYIAGLAINSQDEVFVCDVKKRDIMVFDEKGKFKYDFSSVKGLSSDDVKQDTYPAHIAVGPDDRLYVSDGKNGHIWIYTRKGTYIGSLGGSEMGLYPSAAHISFDKAGNIHILEGLANEVVKIAPTGSKILTIGERGSKAGQFLRPSGLAVDSAGRIFVSDIVLSVIQIFDEKGTLIGVTKQIMDEKGSACSMKGLNHIFIGRDDTIYIIELPRHTITALKK